MEVPKEWADYGARWGDDGLLYLAEWRRGFNVHELRSMFWRCQQVTSLEIDLKRATHERDDLEQRLIDAEKRAAFYRRSLILESRIGAMLTRITA